MKTYFLFVDTETSGFPANMETPVTQFEKWPYVLQIAWQIHSRDGILIKKENHFIYEPDINIEKATIKIHGITLDELKNSGEHRKSIVKKFIKDLKYYNPLIIGHFVEFDSKMIQVMMIRTGLKNVLKGYKHFCTMRSMTEYKRYPNQDYPKLEDLYEGIFHRKLENQHDAAVDAEATASCFFELYRRGEIDDNMIDKQTLFEKMRQKVRKSSGCGLPVLVALLLGLLLFML